MLWRAMGGNGADLDAFDVVKVLLFAAWPISLAFVLRQTTQLHIGPEGMYGRIEASQKGILEWRDVRSVEWDRDVGQQQYGVSIEVDASRQAFQKLGTYKRRMFVPRDAKPEVEELMDKYWGEWKREHPEFAGSFVE
jgi:hypothetical protein